MRILRCLGALSLLVLAFSAGAAEERYGIGQEVSSEDYAAWNISVFPDGTGLPDGSGTATRGQQLFQQHCVRCHGFCGANNNCANVQEDNARFNTIGEVQNDLCYPKLSAIELRGWPLGTGDVTPPTCRPLSRQFEAKSGQQVIGTYWPHATTVFDYIRRAMPFWQPQSLTDDEVYSLTAYLLYLNGLVDAEERIDKNNLAKIQMPNQDSFIDCSVEQCRPDTDNTACMEDCEPLVPRMRRSGETR